MKDIISQGKALYWATSAWPSIRIMEAIHICDKIGAPRPIADQCKYNMLRRDEIEKEYRVLFDDYNYGSTTWSPLEYGILTGKYNNGIPEGSRFDKMSGFFKGTFESYFGEANKEKTLKMLNKLEEIAKRFDASMTQLALAWVLGSKDVSTVIFGSSKLSQLQENMKAVELKTKITKETWDEIEEVLGNRPEPASNYREGYFGKLKLRR